MRYVLLTVLFASSLSALEQGELKFSFGGKNFSTSHAAAAVQTKKGKTRILIAVKDADAKFILLLTADVAKGQEKQPLFLDTQNASLSVMLRTRQGSFTVMPHIQLAPIDPNLTYLQAIPSDTGQIEEDPNDLVQAKIENRAPRRQKKIRMHYERIKPRWHGMNRKEREQKGEGIIRNSAFKDTHFSLQLVPVIFQDKVVAYTGTFAGVGRYAVSRSGAEAKPVHGGVFNVKVENVQ